LTPPTPRCVVLDTPLDRHGALDFAELERLGIDPGSIIDFSTSTNPFGPSPKVRAAIQQVAIDRYPDRESIALRRALAAKLSMSPDRIMVGNGTAELIWLLCFAYLNPADRVLILGPTFGEYQRSAALMEARIVTVTARAEDHFSVNGQIVSRALAETQPRMAFICNPNNPTGSILQPDIIGHWAKMHPHTLLVIDEAYIRFVPGMESVLTLNQHNVVLLRSMTKDYAIAGLRLGYGVAAWEVVEALVKVRPPWSVNAVAQAAGLAALDDETYLQDTMKKLQVAKADLLVGLDDLGLSPAARSAHYFLIDVGSGAAFRSKLLMHHVQVRDCDSFGLPAYIRLATRRPEENAVLLAAIKQVRKNPGDVKLCV
jgi:histidinol-phosphate aminotransferase